MLEIKRNLEGEYLSFQNEDRQDSKSKSLVHFGFYNSLLRISAEYNESEGSFVSTRKVDLGVLALLTRTATMRRVPHLDDSEKEADM
jgi:hypothetical protein